MTRAECRSGDQQGERTRAWNERTIGTALNADAQPTRDVALGDGLRFHLGEGGRAKTLEVFPGHSSIRLEAPDARIELHRLTAPRVNAQGVVFETNGDAEALRMSLSARGEVIVFRAPGKPALLDLVQTAPTSEEVAATVPNQRSEAERATTAPAGKEQQPRLTVRGRVGALPSFRTTPKGVFVGRFPVGARADDDTTVWHTVLAFGERAKKLEGTLQKGEIVEVVGYVHERQQRRRDGTTKQVSELYAVAVRRR